MLEPNTRMLLTQAFRAPAGYQFDCGIATTYSLDLTTLLGATLHLSVFGEEGATDELKNGVALLEALRRIATKLTVFCQTGHIAVPKMAHVLYGLLEPMVVPVTAPLGGVFHPKLWVLRFISSGTGDPVLLRVLVLSRNLTNDRCWDVALALEGRPTGMNRRDNEGLRELVAALPTLSGSITREAGKRTNTLAGELHSAKWELPDGFEEIRFEALGLRPRRWKLPENQRLAIISPFCSIEALTALTTSTGDPALLISRAEELDKLSGGVEKTFRQCMVLRDGIEAEDGEDTSADSAGLRGLHAKVYIGQDGSNTRITFGSANATKTALVDCRNVELLTELIGKKNKIGGIDDLLSPQALGSILEPYSRNDLPAQDDESLEAQRRLDDARRALSAADLRIECAGEKDCWRLTLRSRHPIDLTGVSTIAAWPISLHRNHKVDASAVAKAGVVDLAVCSLAAVTGFIAFEMTAGKAPETTCFVLNLPVDGLPQERRAAVVRTIVANREGFLKYLRFLLADFDDDGLPNDLLLAITGEGQGKSYGYSLQAALPLLEEMTRALSRDPDRLHSIESLVRDLTETEEGREIVPKEFLDLWSVYSTVLGEVRR